MGEIGVRWVPMAGEDGARRRQTWGRDEEGLVAWRWAAMAAVEEGEEC